MVINPRFTRPEIAGSPPDHPELTRLRSKLRGERLHELVAKKLALDPRPSDDQLAAIVELINAHMSHAG